MKGGLLLVQDNKHKDRYLADMEHKSRCSQVSSGGPFWSLAIEESYYLFVLLAMRK